MLTCTYTAQVFGAGKHPDDEDDDSGDDGNTNDAATESLSELSAPASSEHVMPQTAADKRLRRLSLQSSKWSDHETSSTAASSTRSASSSGSKTDKEIDDLVQEIQKAMSLKGSMPSEKLNESELKENKPSQKVTALKLQVEMPTGKLHTTKELPIHVAWLSLAVTLGMQYIYIYIYAILSYGYFLRCGQTCANQFKSVSTFHHVGSVGGRCWSPSKKTLDAPLPEAFPQNAQYKKNFRKNEGEADHDQEDEVAEVPNKRKKMKAKKKRKTAKGPAQAKCASKTHDATDTEEYSPQRYSGLRKKFIDDLRAEGVTYKSASSQWNSSALKKQLLASLDLPELKRRRFVTKDCTENPWAN